MFFSKEKKRKKVLKFIERQMSKRDIKKYQNKLKHTRRTQFSERELKWIYLVNHKKYFSYGEYVNLLLMIFPNSIFKVN